MAHRKTATIYTDLIGEGIHVGLRKASEHPASGYAWRAIADLPNDEWQAIVEYAVAGSTVDLPATDKQALANPKVQALVEALEWYGSHGNYEITDQGFDAVYKDGGDVARAALAELKGRDDE